MYIPPAIVYTVLEVTEGFAGIMKTAVIAVVVAVCILGGTLPVMAAARYPFYNVFAAESFGFVFYADGQTPAVEVPVRVWDLKERKFIYETLTGKDGSFQLPKFEPGQYYVTFDTLRLDLAVAPIDEAKAQQPHDIVVILPRVATAMPLFHLNAILMASTLSEGALLYRNENRRDVVSP